MIAGHHYDPDNVTAYMAEKHIVRLLLSIAAARNWTTEHMDISSAYLYENYCHKKQSS